MKLHLSVFREAYFQIKKNSGEQEKESIIRVRVEEKSVPWDHCLSSLGKPRDAKQQSSARIVLYYHHTHDRFL